jgi:hypothetical protein
LIRKKGGPLRGGVDGRAVPGDVHAASRTCIRTSSSAGVRLYGRLNQAVFIAVAKKGFKDAGGEERERPEGLRRRQECTTWETTRHTRRRGSHLVIGGKAQTREDFERPAVSRFGGHLADARKESLACVWGFDSEMLLSSRVSAEVRASPEEMR